MFIILVWFLSQLDVQNPYAIVHTTTTPQAQQELHAPMTRCSERTCKLVRQLQICFVYTTADVFCFYKYKLSPSTSWAPI